jgi:hypothetical protein
MKKFFKYSIPLLTFLLLHFYGNTTDKKNAGEIEDCKNYISIHGSSNINQFQFVNYNLKINPSTNASEDQANYQHIRIPVYDFTGPNDRMLNDFYEMVSASEYPYIQISIEPKEKADFDETSGNTNFRTVISLAGQSRNYIVPCDILFCENSEYILKGELEVELTDFKIKPPVKVFGAVKVSNEVFINFAFKLKNEEALTEKITF